MANQIRYLISFFLLLTMKVMAQLLYRFKVQWPDNNKNVPWNEVRLIALLNHTSLAEPLYVGVLPVHFLWRLSRKMVAPGADKTLHRPLVGTFYKLFSPGMVSITRKRDDSWQEFMNAIAPDSVIVIIPEGRMKRPNGLDLNGQKMTIRGGIADILAGLNSGKLVIAYSGGLHHVHAPGEMRFRIFTTLKLNLELMDIAGYNNSFGIATGSEEWRKNVIADFQHRLETRVPKL